VKNLAKSAETETGSKKYLCIGLVVLAVVPIVAKRLARIRENRHPCIREGDEVPAREVIGPKVVGRSDD
jgi:hypothetical protein